MSLEGPLPPHIWFVRSNGGAGSFPVTRQGWAAFGIFALGMAVGSLLCARFVYSGYLAIGVTVLVLTVVASSSWLMFTARKHTDFTITYSEYLRRSKNKT